MFSNGITQGSGSLKRVLCAFAVFGLILCGGCSKAVSDDVDVRNYWSTVETKQADLKISTNLGDTALEYQLEYVYNGNDSDNFTITYPESLAGISGKVSGNGADGLTLQYADTILDDMMPVRSGMTPADAFSAIVCCLRDDAPTETWTETVSEQTLLVMRYEDADAIGSIARQVWLTADGTQIVYAEVYDDTECLLTITVTGYQ